ncbi:MAG: hypothetical protein M1826_004016 [Phylliscum demangeonii]|nr:MAG: hypothetical protein M1826_004016 [Phylliscum demangeonii]
MVVARSDERADAAAWVSRTWRPRPGSRLLEGVLQQLSNETGQEANARAIAAAALPAAAAPMFVTHTLSATASPFVLSAGRRISVEDLITGRQGRRLHGSVVGPAWVCPRHQRLLRDPTSPGLRHPASMVGHHISCAIWRCSQAEDVGRPAPREGPGLCPGARLALLQAGDGCGRCRSQASTGEGVAASRKRRASDLFAADDKVGGFVGLTRSPPGAVTIAAGASSVTRPPPAIVTAASMVGCRISVEQLFAAADKAGGLPSSPRPHWPDAAISVEQLFAAADKAGGLVGLSRSPPGAVTVAARASSATPLPPAFAITASMAGCRISVEQLFAAAVKKGGFVALSRAPLGVVTPPPPGIDGRPRAGGDLPTPAHAHAPVLVVAAPNAPDPEGPAPVVVFRTIAARASWPSLYRVIFLIAAVLLAILVGMAGASWLAVELMAAQAAQAQAETNARRHRNLLAGTNFEGMELKRDQLARDIAALAAAGGSGHVSHVVGQVDADDAQGPEHSVPRTGDAATEGGLGSLSRSTPAVAVVAASLAPAFPSVIRPASTGAPAVAADPLLSPLHLLSPLSELRRRR